MYVVVEFPEEETDRPVAEVVPKNWLLSDNRCRWPVKNYLSKAKQCATPKPDWSTHEVKVVNRSESGMSQSPNTCLTSVRFPLHAQSMGLRMGQRWQKAVAAFSCLMSKTDLPLSHLLSTLYIFPRVPTYSTIPHMIGQSAKCGRFRRDLVGAGVWYPPKSLGQFLKIWGRVRDFGADIVTKYIYTFGIYIYVYIYICKG